MDGKAYPRVPFTDMKRKASDGPTALTNQQLYTDRESAISIARWEEAQLIIAERQRELFRDGHRIGDFRRHGPPSSPRWGWCVRTEASTGT